MKTTGRTQLERETSITFNEKEKFSIVWSASKLTEKKMNALGVKGENDGGGMRWSIPKSWIKIRKPRDMSEEQRNVLRERFKINSLSRRLDATGLKKT